MVQAPSIGSVIHGFRVLSVDPHPFRDALFIGFEHTQSGARLLYVACDDTDRAFNIAFRTVAHDNKGLPHIFEHSTLAGSDKYPSSNLIFEMMNRTYTTFLNAATYQCATMYPSSSLSEEQLLTNLDVYMSGVTSPTLLTDEHGLRREAFRYVLNDPDSEIVPTGAVYNEMKGNFAKITYAAFRNTLQSLFPDSIQSYVTGGVPEDVLTVTWEDVREFHAAYYHPSNMLISLYGDLDYRRFLSFLDGNYLSRFTRKELTIRDDRYQPFTGERRSVFLHPASAGSNPSKGSVLNYAIALNGISIYDRTLLSVISTAFNLDSSALKQAVSKRLPGSVLDCGLVVLPTPAFCFSLTNVDPEDSPVFEECLRDALSELSRNGLDPDIIRMAVNTVRMKTILDAEDSGGITLISDLSVDWSCTGNMTAYLEECRAYQDLEKCAEDGAFDRLIREHLSSPSQSVLVLTRPDPGAAEAADAQLKSVLTERKAAMTRDELAALVEENKDFERWAKENESVSMIDRVNSVTVADLPEEAVSAAVEESDANGVHYVFSPVPEAKYVDLTLLLDSSGIAADSLHDYAFFSYLLGALATESRSFSDVEKQLSIYAYDYSFKWENHKFKEGGHRPFLSINVLFLREYEKEIFDIVTDILLHTSFSDFSRIRSLAARELNEKKNQARTSPHILIFSLARAMANPDAAYDGYLGFSDYWDYLRRVSAMTDPEMEALAAKFRSIRDTLTVRSNLTAALIGSHETFAVMQRNIEKLTDDFPNAPDPAPSETGSLPSFPRTLAVELEGTVQYNGHYILGRDSGFPYSAKMRVLFTIVRSSYLLPELRFRHGAYSVFCSAGEKEYYVFSYRDPEFQNTFETFSKIDSWLAEQTFTQSDLDGPITSCYSDLARPSSPLDRAKDAIFRTLCHMYEPDYLLKGMRELKQFRPEDITALAPVFRALCGNGVTISAAPHAVIENNKDRFERIITDLLQ